MTQTNWLLVRGRNLGQRAGSQSARCPAMMMRWRARHLSSPRQAAGPVPRESAGVSMATCPVWPRALRRPFRPCCLPSAVSCLRAVPELLAAHITCGQTARFRQAALARGSFLLRPPRLAKGPGRYPLMYALIWSARRSVMLRPARSRRRRFLSPHACCPNALSLIPLRRRNCSISAVTCSVNVLMRPSIGAYLPRCQVKTSKPAFKAEISTAG